MTFLLLLGLLMPAITHAEDQADNQFRLTSEQILKLEQLMDSYPAEDLLNQIAILKLEFIRNTDRSISFFTEEDKQKIQQLQLSCDKDNGFTRILHVPGNLKALNLNEKLAIAMNDASIASSSNERTRRADVIRRINQCEKIALNHYDNMYLKEHNLSNEQYAVIELYHEVRFHIEVRKLLYTILQQSIATEANETQKDLFKKVPIITDDNSIIPLKKSIISASQNDDGGILSSLEGYFWKRN